ncbi:MAG TPA: hypothetical protein VGK26_07820 [Thermoanaerobaculia bacterium]
MKRPLLLLALCASLTASCSRNAPYRLGPGGAVDEARIRADELENSALRAPLATSGVEIHDDYRLHFLEFDDQGQLYATAQFQRLVDSLERDAASPEKARIVLVLYVHGWKNNASLCNGNVCCFRTFVSRIAGDLKLVGGRSQGFLGATRVVGIYVGWRGLSATVPPFKALSFWARKKAAGNVGQGELVEVLSFLDRYQKHLNAQTPNRCRLVMMGHSLGGAVLYSAMANILKSRITEARVKGVLDGQVPTIEGFGDLVVLANPAFEASLYAPVHELIESFAAFAPRQSPLLVVLSSETDMTTRTTFRIGRWLETLFQRTGPRSPRDMIVRTVGNYDPFVTHRAAVAADARGSAGGSSRGVVENCECTLPMSEIDAETADRLLRVLRMSSEEAARTLTPTLCPGHDRLGVVELDCVAPHAPGLPLWVVRADNAVVSGHSGFFTRPVTDIVRNLVARRILEEMIATTAGSASGTR